MSATSRTRTPRTRTTSRASTRRPADARPARSTSAGSGRAPARGRDDGYHDDFERTGSAFRAVGGHRGRVEPHRAALPASPAGGTRREAWTAPTTAWRIRRAPRAARGRTDADERAARPGPGRHRKGAARKGKGRSLARRRWRARLWLAKNQGALVDGQVVREAAMIPCTTCSDDGYGADGRGDDYAPPTIR